MSVKVSYLLQIKTSTGQEFAFNSTGSSGTLNAVNSYGSFEPSAIQKEKTTSENTISIFIPYQDDALPSWTAAINSPTLLSTMGVKYSIIVDGVATVLLYGTIESSTRNNLGVNITVSSYLNRLQFGNVFLFSENCRHVFGSSKSDLKSGCGFNLASVTTAVTITSIAPDRLSMLVSGTYANNLYRDGSFTFSQHKQDIALNDNNTIYLWDELPPTITAGAGINLIRGCAKSVSACQGYSNFDNFGGNPYELAPTLFGNGREKILAGINAVIPRND